MPESGTRCVPDAGLRRGGESSKRIIGREEDMPLDAADDSISWYVYLVRCADGSLYAGIATNVERRVQEHNGHDTLSAKYTRARRPVTLVYQETVDSRSAALKREHAIKRLSKVEKEALVSQTGFV